MDSPSEARPVYDYWIAKEEGARCMDTYFNFQSVDQQLYARKLHQSDGCCCAPQRATAYKLALTT